MRFFRNLPIGSKLTLITTAISGMALLLAGVAFTIYEQAALRQTMARDFAILVDIFDDNVASGLAFNDPASIEQTLNTLSAHQRIVIAGVYDRQGQLVAQYRRAGAPDGFEFPTAGLSGQRFGDDRLDTFRDIRLAGEKIGVVYIGAELSELSETAWLYATIVGALLLGCSLVALLLTARLQRIISGPIVDLAQTVATVAAEKNYAVRAHKQSDDELGRLIDGFNEMLAQIQARDAALQQAHDELENRVQERTGELQQEIAERRRSEEALRQSHQRFEMVTQATSDIIWDRNMQTGAVWRNENFQTVFGYLPGEIAPTTEGWSSCVHPDDLPGARELPAEALRSGGKLWSSEYRFRRRDGSYAFLLDRGYIIRDEQGQPLRMIGAMQDVTALKQAQAEAAREKDRLQLIFESVPVGICLDQVRSGGERDRLLNSAHLAICGQTRDQAVAGVFERLTHPDDVARQASLRRQLDEGSIGQFSLEKRYIKPDGQIVWVVFTLQRRRFADGDMQDLSTVVDITDLKRAQEQAAREQARFKFIFESVPVGISLVAAAGDLNTLIVNPAHERITGVSAQESILPHAFERASHPDDYRRQSELVQPFIRGEVDHYSIEKRYLHANGREIWAVLTSRKYTEVTGSVPQVVTTLIDITERKQAEARLAETHKQLLHTSRQAGMAEVATGVLHNVGNVLNSVNVSATLVMDQMRESKIANLPKIGAMLQERAGDLVEFLTNDPKGRKIPAYLVTLAGQVAAERTIVAGELGHLQKNIEHIKDIVAMQQSYARVTGVSETIAISELVEDALRMNASALARHAVDIVRDFEPGLPVTVERHKVLQVLVNLIRNAKHACDDSGRSDKQITVRVTHDDLRVRIGVIDNGVGIPAENLTRIFAHGFTTRKEGHGFGLHSGALAARELGGSLIAQSDGPGRGATFTLELPRPTEAQAA